MKYVLFLLVLITMGCARDISRKDHSPYYGIICIDKHEYYKQRSGYAGLAIRLNSDGKPIKCKGNN